MKKILLFLVLVSSTYQLIAQNEHIRSYDILKSAYNKWGSLKSDFSRQEYSTDNNIKYNSNKLNSLIGKFSDLSETIDIATKKCNKALEQLGNCNKNFETKETLIIRYKYIKGKLGTIDSKSYKTKKAFVGAHARFRAGAKAGVSSRYWKEAGPEAMDYLTRADESFESLITYLSSFINKEKYRLNIDNSLKNLPEWCNQVETPIETVFEENYRLAKSGDKNAQYNLGIMYYNSQEVEKNLESSFYWMNKSAKQEKTRAQYLVGLKYIMGEGVEKDRNKAMLWTKKAAIKGDRDAQYLLGLMYFNGSREKYYSDRDWKKSEPWLIKAKSQGVTKAQKLLDEINEMKKNY